MRIMNLSERKIISKIPGMLIERPNSEKQGYIDNLSSKTKPELQELLERQDKILNNKGFVAKLPDKGAKIKEFREKILLELKNKDVIDQACTLLSNLDLSKKHILEDLEWGKKHSDYAYVDSDDEIEEKDPLKIIAQSSAPNKKLVKTLPVQPDLITKDDIEEITQSILDEPHVKYVIDKDANCKKVFKNKFKPYKSTISDVHNPFKEALRKRGAHWENTAATPPPSVHGPVKTLSLQESLILQKQQEEVRKEVELKHAHEKLLEHLHKPSISALPIGNKIISGEYRTVKVNESDDDDEVSAHGDLNDSENEVLDDEEDHSRTLTYTVSEYVTTNALEQQQRQEGV